MNITVFENDIAEKYGVTEAIILHSIKYWIDKNIANNAEMKDDRYWTYNTIKAFTELLPYLSPRVVNSALKHLQNEGIIVIGNYNKAKFDRTQWYSITDKGYDLFDSQKCKLHFTKTLNGNVENVKPIPNSIPNSYEDSNTNPIIPSIENKKAEEEKQEIPDYLQEPIKAWQEMRKKMRKPVTDYALKLALSSIEKLSSDPEVQVAIVNQSILRGWLGFFTLKNDEKKGEPVEKIRCVERISEHEWLDQYGGTHLE